MSDTGTALRVGVAEEVRVAMARRRVRSVELAAAIGRSQAYVSRRLNGETAFDVDDLEAIARKLDVKPRELMPTNEKPPLRKVDPLAPRLVKTGGQPNGHRRVADHAPRPVRAVRTHRRPAKGAMV